jgi:hypothetical protein
LVYGHLCVDTVAIHITTTASHQRGAPLYSAALAVAGCVGRSDPREVEQ